MKTTITTRKEFEGLRCEGNRGFQDLCVLARSVNGPASVQQLYNNNGTSVSDLIEFLENNPGAIQAIYNWVEEEDHFCDECGELKGESQEDHVCPAMCKDCGEPVDEDGVCPICDEECDCCHDVPCSCEPEEDD